MQLSEQPDWKAGVEVAGYWKRVGPLTQVVLRGCGHMVGALGNSGNQSVLDLYSVIYSGMYFGLCNHRAA